MFKTLGVVGGLLVLAAFAFTVGQNQDTASADGGSTVYASFSGKSASGLVKVVNFGSPSGSLVVARIKRPSSGLIGFCLTEANGSRSCGTVNPAASSFDTSSHGCVSFIITLTEIPTSVEIFDANFVNSLAAAELTPIAPRNLGYLNRCEQGKARNNETGTGTPSDSNHET